MAQLYVRTVNCETLPRTFTKLATKNSRVVLSIVAGAPDRIRTCDLSLRRRTLYPAELRAQRAFKVRNVAPPPGGSQVHEVYTTNEHYHHVVARGWSVIGNDYHVYASSRQYWRPPEWWS